MNYVISLKSNPAKAETVEEGQLLDACARLSEGGIHPLNIAPQAAPVRLNSTF